MSDVIEWHSKRIEDADRAIHEALEGCDESVFLEPFLFTWDANAAGPMPLSQIVFGYLSPEQQAVPRPVTSNADGVIVIPGHGALCTEIASSVMMLRKIGKQYGLQREGASVDFEWADVERVPGTSVELHRHRSAPLRTFVDNRGEFFDHVDVKERAASCVDDLRRAFERIGEVAPEHRALLERSCRRIVIVDEPGIQSMAAYRMQGVVILSAVEGASEVFFAEDLAHQIGHVTLNMATRDTEALFTIPAETLMSVLTGNPDDYRSVYVAFHGNYTLVRMIQLFEALLDNDVYQGQLRHELLGRLALVFPRLIEGIRSINDERLFTPTGWRLHKEMLEETEALYLRCYSLTNGLDVSNQPYVFDYARFISRNPMSNVA